MYLQTNLFTVHGSNGSGSKLKKRAKIYSLSLQKIQIWTPWFKKCLFWCLHFRNRTNTVKDTRKTVIPILGGDDLEKKWLPPLIFVWPAFFIFMKLSLRSIHTKSGARLIIWTILVKCCYLLQHDCFSWRKECRSLKQQQVPTCLRLFTSFIPPSLFSPYRFWLDF